jgi:hypothetical protein
MSLISISLYINGSPLIIENSSLYKYNQVIDLNE